VERVTPTHDDDAVAPTPRTRAVRARRGPRPATGTADLDVAAPDVWDLVTNVRNHARWVPLTRIETPGPRLAVGDTFTAVTGPRAGRGGRGLTDRMILERLDPPSGSRPGVAVYRKLGPVLLGEATVQVRPTGPASCTVVWTEDVHLRGLPRRLTTPLLRPFLALMLRVMLRRMRREVAGPRS
jgi:hypothetical protein